MAAGSELAEFVTHSGDKAFSRTSGRWYKLGQLMTQKR